MNDMTLFLDLILLASGVYCMSEMRTTEPSGSRSAEYSWRSMSVVE